MLPVRVRFAPSPTGHLHVGGARTALYNYLFAKQTGGQFILRIEDTDLSRTVAGGLEGILEALRWLGIHWDEGPDIGGPHAPYNQTGRKDLYLQYAQQLLESDHAYRCFCTQERLKQVREEQQKRKENPQYDGTCRALDPKEAEARAAAGEKFVIRFKTPAAGFTTVRDELRGDITVDNRTIDDYVLVKSDGFALYHLAAMVDDHEMGITHVFRSSEWLGTFPLHALIVRAFGWAEPAWCHLSVFLKPSGKGKMSKRDVSNEQSIFVLGLRDLGYVPEAINNWMALMGASFGADESVLSMDEMIAKFRLSQLTPSAARVNFEKLDHFNGLYLRSLSAEDLAARIQPFFAAAGYAVTAEQLRPIAPLIRERIVTLDDAVAFAGFFFHEEVTPKPEALVGKKMTAAESAEAARKMYAALAALPSMEHAPAEAALRALVEANGWNTGAAFGILRVAVTGQTVSPPLFESMALIGKDKVLARLRKAIEVLEGM